MKIRNRSKAEKIEPQMAPMIDVVFQLLIFFMLTLKVIPPEGDFNINMPQGAPGSSSEVTPTPPMNVTLRATSNGDLAEVRFGTTPLGNDPSRVFQELNRLVKKNVGAERGVPVDKDAEVEIKSDYNLDYRWTIRAAGAVMGKFDPESEKVVPYVEKVKFAPPVKLGS